MDPSSSQQQSFTSPSLEQDFIPQQSQNSLLESSDEESPLFARNLNPNPRQRVNSDAPALDVEVVEAAAEFARELTPIERPIDRRNDAAGALALLSQQAQSCRVSVSGATPVVPAVTAASAPESAQSKFGNLVGASVEDIELVADNMYVIQKGKPDKTRIKSISGVAMQDVRCKPLYAWCAANNIKLPRRDDKNKVNTCRAIEQFKDIHDRTMAARANNPVEPAAPAPAAVADPPTRTRVPHICFVRLVNLLNLDNIRAGYINRGNTMTKEQLDRGEIADQEFWQLATDTYNDPTVEHLGILHWPVDWRQQPNPASFDQVSMQKICTSVKKLGSQYDKAYYDWKQSGHHEGIETRPFVAFSGNTWLLYLHQMLLPHPGLLSSLKKDLPAGVRTESGSGNEKAGRKRKEYSPKGDSEALKTMAEASQQRSKTMAYGVLNNAINQNKESIDTAKKAKNEAVLALKNHGKVYSSKHAKQFVEYATKKSESEVDLNEESYDGDWPFSQHSTDSFDTRVLVSNDIVDHENAIKSARARMASQEEELAKMTASRQEWM